METTTINDATPQFNFKPMTLVYPVSLSNQQFLTRIEYNKESLYIQTPPCRLKQGLQKSGKRFVCDLMFSMERDSDFLQWMYGLEHRCQELLYAKRDKWFKSDLEETDIEEALLSPVRNHIPTQEFTVRMNVKSTPANEPHLKIFNEQEMVVSHDAVPPASSVICIVEIVGIKYTVHTFQIELEIKQMLVLNPPKQIFEERILIRRPAPSSSMPEVTLDDFTEVSSHVPEIVAPPALKEEEPEPQPEPEQPQQQQEAKEEEKEEEEEEEEDDEEEEEEEEEEDDDDSSQYMGPLNFEEEEVDLEGEIEELSSDIPSTVKTRQQIQAEKKQEYASVFRKKALEAKRIAIEAYLAAKRFKKEHNVIIDDDEYSDIDEEIDAVSDVDLDDL